MISSFQQIFENFIKYGDDRNLFYPMTQIIDSVLQTMSKNKVSDWLCVNTGMLSVNVKKTKFINTSSYLPFCIQ